MGFVIFLAILAAMAGYGLSVYNGLVALRQQVRQAWGDIDALLVQRHDELAQRLEAYASARLSPSRAASARIRVAVVEELDDE